MHNNLRVCHTYPNFWGQTLVLPKFGPLSVGRFIFVLGVKFSGSYMFGHPKRSPSLWVVFQTMVGIALNSGRKTPWGSVLQDLVIDLFGVGNGLALVMPVLAYSTPKKCPHGDGSSIPNNLRANRRHSHALTERTPFWFGALSGAVSICLDFSVS